MTVHEDKQSANLLIGSRYTETTNSLRLSVYLLLSRRPASLAGSSVSGLHLQHRAEKLLGGLCEEADLSVGMESVEVWGLSR